MSAAQDTQFESKPYKGPESYQVEDAELFFGRDNEARQLTAKILSSRLTLMHAQSGTGKTSLLNARVIPDLEARGWTPVRILPHTNPIESTRAAVLKDLFPSPEAELMGLERALGALSEPGEDPDINTLLARYDELPIRDALRRYLISPIKKQATELEENKSDEGMTPYIARVLRASLDMEIYNEHIRALLSEGGYRGTMPARITAHTTGGELTALFKGEALSQAYANLMNELTAPAPTLWAFFENLVQTYGRLRKNFGIILIFDQFEELFTRFIDPGPVQLENAGDLPDWRLRWEFWRQLQLLYEKEYRPDVQQTHARFTTRPLPLRFVISMRSEYIAQLDPVRRFVWDLDESTYHLELLAKAEAQMAIKRPAEKYGYTYSDECFDMIINELTKEERYVEPAHLQIVCEKLWYARGSDIALENNATSDAAQKTLPQIELKTFKDLHGTRGILKRFLDDYLQHLQPEARIVALELLEPLITSAGTRNIVELQQLLQGALWSRAPREELLRSLVDHTIIRVERRLGGHFAEITHEFLIAPILEAVRRELHGNPDYNRFLSASRILERLHNTPFRDTETKIMSKDEFLLVHEFRERLNWPDWAEELMFRAAILCSPSAEIMREWSERFAHAQEAHGQDSVMSFLSADRLGGRLLALDELEALNQQRAALELSDDQLAFILRSTLAKSAAYHRDEVIYWTRRLAR